MDEPLTTEQPCEHDWLDMHEAGNWRFICQKCGANSPYEPARCKIPLDKVGDSEPCVP